MNRTDFDSEEREFRREIQAAMTADREAAGACPSPDLLMAARSGVDFDGSEDVQRHMALCPICEQLVQDLAEYEFPAASDEEDRRIRARWQDPRSRPVRSQLRIWAPLLVAAMLVVGIFVARGTRQPTALQNATPVQHSTPPAAEAFNLAKAAIKIPASAVLTYRNGAGGTQTYLADLATALAPYRKDDYAEAADRLGAVSRKYPDAAEPAFYKGVSQLFLNQNDAAIESLQQARRRAGETLRDDVSWYLALAFNRVGRISDASHEAEALCSHAGDYKDRACAAADELRAK
jgi:hypothetical protein